MKKRWIILWLSAMTLNVTAQNEPYKNPELSPSERAWDLLKRMTLEEKVSQMKNGSPAIERLGIPAYDWWNEALHGVARAGKATVFPQAIGLAATFDNQAVYETFDIVSDEARAKYHDFQRKGERDGYKGLTFWTPNINIYRDPRWGRGIFVEVLKDVSSGLAPLSYEEAYSMIHSLRAYKIIQGTRGQKGVNEDKFAEIIVRLSTLLRFATEIKEMDMNPLLATDKEVIAVDARIRIEK